MLYQIQKATVSLDGEVILDHMDFQIKGREKIALVGRNGAGKTTLLRLLAGELEPDRDDKRQEQAVYKARSFSVGMLRQDPVTDPHMTLEDWIMSCWRNRYVDRRCAANGTTEEGHNGAEKYTGQSGAGRSSYEQESDDVVKDQDEQSNVEGILDEMDSSVFEFRAEFHRRLTGMGFRKEDGKKRLGDFSGGEKTKLMLLHLLQESPELLLLDEPTNHLDMETTEWLEEELRNYPGAMVLISHDRFFLDRVADVVWEVREKKLYRYVGGYTAYRQTKLQNYEKDLRRYEAQQAEIRHLNELIERFRHKPTKASFARSRKKMLERMELMERPAPDEAQIFTGKIEPRRPGSKWVLETEELQIGYDKTLLELNLRIRRGQKIGIIGANGVGKSTLLKTIMGQIPPRKGKYIFGNHVEVGYYDQLTSERFSRQSEEKRELVSPTVYEWFRERFPGLLQQDARKILGQYLFTGRLTATPVADLSGGEKARLALCEILTSRPNLLLLDEPTNHMDIPAKETLESAFCSYTGTMVFVSHDRYFLSKVADALLVLEGGKAYYYPFGYEHYLERRRRFAEGEGDPNAMSALVQAENAALLEGMRGVPKRERHESRQMTSDEAHKDWQLRLAKDPMEAAKERVEALTARRDQAKTLEEYEMLQRELDQVTEEWTRLCADWYDVWRS